MNWRAVSKISKCIATWPEFVVIRTTPQVEEQTTVVAVYMVLKAESEQFMEPFQD